MAEQFKCFVIIQKNEDGTVVTDRSITLKVHPESNGIQEVTDYLRKNPGRGLERGWVVSGIIEEISYKAIEQKIKDQANAVHSDF